MSWRRMAGRCVLGGSAVLLCTLPSGCSLSDSSSKYQSTAESSEIAFSWWGNDERHLYTMNAVDLFQELNPEISVSYRYGSWNGFEKRTKVWMASRKEADVMQINYAWLSEYSADGDGFYDLYQLQDYIDLSTFTEADLKFGEVNGKLNAIPIAFNTSTMFYNQELYDSYGLELPVTWDDFFEAAEVMSADGIYPLGMVKKQLFLFLISYYEQSTGKHFFSTDGSLLAEPEDIASILEFYEKLLTEHVLMPIDQFSTSKFTRGEVAGSMFWISDSDNYCTYMEENGFTPVIGEYPTLDGSSLSGWYMKPATMYAISSITQYPEASAQLLDFLVNSVEMADYQKTEKGVPVSKSALQELSSDGLLVGYSYEANQKMLDAQDSMGIMIPVMENEDVIDAFKEGADEYLYGRVSLNESAENIWQKISQLIS
jgi:oligogalacturonide transport system substrate-binding protein